MPDRLDSATLHKSLWYKDVCISVLASLLHSHGTFSLAIKQHRLWCVLMTSWLFDLPTHMCSHMQEQEMGLDRPAGGSLTALKPIKATWVCSHAWLEKWPGGVWVCVFMCALTERWPGGAGCSARLAASHMLHNRFPVPWKACPHAAAC